MAAASQVSPPAFPPVNMRGQPYHYQNPLRLLRVFEMPHHFKLPMSGFHLFERTTIRTDIIQTFLDISEMSQAIQIFLEHDQYARSFTAILDCRSDLLYRLLCLPATAEEVFASNVPALWFTPEQNMNAMLYLCVRLAAQLYSLHVIFPIPRVASVRQQLIPEITKVVAWFDGRATEDGHKQLLLWACMITALAAWGEDSEIELWSVTWCRQLITDLGITTYDELKDLLHVFGWIDLACDGCGILVWTLAFGMVRTIKQH